MTTVLDAAEEALRTGRSAEACSLLEGALAGKLEAEQRAEALSMLGMARLSAGKTEAALEPLRQAVELDRDEGMFRYNYAVGLEAAGRLSEAIDQHRQAVKLSNGMPQLTVALVRALLKSGAFAEAAHSIAPLARSAGAPTAVRLLYVEALRGSGDLYAAWDAIQPLVPANLSLADPANRRAALLAARIASDAQYHEAAERLARGLVRSDPSDKDAAAILAPLVLWADGREAARKIIDDAIERAGPTPELLVQLLGFGTDVDTDRVATAKRLGNDRKVHPYHRAQLLMALAQYHDRQGDTQAAWELAREGNALSPVAHRRNWRAILQDHLEIYRQTEDIGDGASTIGFLYLCGAPRSGQSLLQSLLAAAPEVLSLGERGALVPHLLDNSQSLRSMADGERTAIFARLAEADAKGIARQAGVHHGWAVDKNPAQLVLAGSIARIHPGAEFAASLRDPADVAISIYLRGFSPFYDYATELPAIIDHLELVADAIAAWRDSGLNIRTYSHERLVEDPEAGTRSLYDWLGLEWDPSYLDPRNRTTPVPTFSAAQVREPIRPDVSRGSEPYADRLEPHAAQLDRIRKKQAELLSADQPG